MSFKILDHEKSKRIKVIKIEEKELDKLIFPFKKHSIQSLEYKPFSRFTIAKALDDCLEKKLSGTLKEILNDRDKALEKGDIREFEKLDKLFRKTKKKKEENRYLKHWIKT